MWNSRRQLKKKSITIPQKGTKVAKIHLKLLDFGFFMNNAKFLYSLACSIEKQLVGERQEICWLSTFVVTKSLGQPNGLRPVLHCIICQFKQWFTVKIKKFTNEIKFHSHHSLHSIKKSLMQRALQFLSNNSLWFRF